MTTSMALGEWADYVRLGLEEGRLSTATVFMKYGSDEVPVAVGTYAELLDRLPRTVEFLQETVIVSAVAGFEAFLEDVHYEFLMVCPSVLPRVVEEESLEHKCLARKEVERPRGVKARLDLLGELAGINFKHAPEGVDVDAAREIVATRNLLIHNNGIVDAEYLKRVPDSDLKAGQLRPITPIYLNDSLSALDALKIFVDSKVAARIVELTGKTMPEYSEHSFGKRPKRGVPRVVISRWCVSPVNQSGAPVGIEGIAAGWSSRGALPDGQIVTYSEFEPEQFAMVQQNDQVIILPSLSTAIGDLPVSLQLRLQSAGLRSNKGEKLSDVLRRIHVQLDATP
jgi:hypothetical protein